VEPTPTPTPTVDPTPQPTVEPTPEPTVIPEPPVVTPDPPVVEPVAPEPPVVEPTPEVITSVEDLPKEITAEVLLTIDLKEIVATDLTPAQAEAIKEAAIETFKTAEAGSPEYEKALDALMVAAKQDDIVVDPALAEIPGVGQAAVAIADAINFIGNVGADMNPVVREEAQKATVAAVIVGQVAGAAVAATASSSGASAGRRQENNPTMRKNK
jgi:hypothetical protein